MSRTPLLPIPSPAPDETNSRTDWKVSNNPTPAVPSNTATNFILTMPISTLTACAPPTMVVDLSVVT